MTLFEDSYKGAVSRLILAVIILVLNLIGIVYQLFFR